MNWPTDFVEANAILAAAVDAESGSGAYEVDAILSGMTPDELRALAQAAEVLNHRCWRMYRNPDIASLDRRARRR